MERTQARLADLACRLDGRARRMTCVSGQSILTGEYWCGDASRVTARKLARKLRNELARRGNPQPLFVYVLSISRHYGGPEEGGWWYDVHELDAVEKAWTARDALRRIKRLREEHPTCRRGRHSVLGGADVVIGVCASEDGLPTETTERPHYE